MYTTATRSCKRVVKENGYRIDEKVGAYYLFSRNIWHRAAIRKRVVKEIEWILLSLDSYSRCKNRRHFLLNSHDLSYIPLL
jgi:hypothetical protein